MALVALLATLLAATTALGKLPPPSEEARAQAAAAAAKAEWSKRVAAYELCREQDRVAAAYFAHARQEHKAVKPAVATPPCVSPGPYVAQAKTPSPSPSPTPAPAKK
ncbi:MAG: hypothetical protein KGN16_04325 [Burkholderiales bacterium]|nr:hypothetical protein [Burkholderiales bacterium]